MADRDIFGVPYEPVWVHPLEQERRKKAALKNGPSQLDAQGLAALFGEQFAQEAGAVPSTASQAGGIPTVLQPNGNPGAGAYTGKMPIPDSGELQQRIAETMTPQGPEGVQSATMNGELPNPRPIPHDLRDATVAEIIRNPFENPNRIAGRSAGYPSGLSQAAPAEAPVKEQPPSSPVPDPKDPTKPIPSVAVPSTADGAGVPGSTVTAPPTAQSPNQMILDIQKQKEMIDAIYPQRDTSASPEEQAANDYADTGLKKAGLMAQLAFFAGITKGAGGQWEAVGQGLAAGGDAYDQGFTRYQNALNLRANRAIRRSDQAYEDNANRTNAAVDLYSSQQRVDQANQKEQLSNARQMLKEQRDNLSKYYENELKSIGDGDFLTPEQLEQKKKIMQKWAAAMPELGIVTDVIDLRKK